MFLLNPFALARSIIEFVRLLILRRELLWALTRREITDRYAGQFLGSLWALGHPLVLMGIYVFVFAVVLKARIGGTLEMPLDYPVYILSGLIPWMAFQEAMNKSVGAISSNANLVKQVIFPIELLPVKGVLAAFLPQTISFVALTIYVFIKLGTVPATYLLLPFLFVLQGLAMMGVAFLFSAVGVYLRDLKEVVQVFCTAGVYLMPIAYLPEWVPTLIRPVLYFNPFSYLAWCYQDAAYFGRFEHPWAWLVLALLSPMTFVAGSRVFAQLKSHFGNRL
jgi:lipopolysaccharide transport system permease protein